MKSESIRFTGAGNLQLAGKLELPADRKPAAFALFAHCFTCSKDLRAVREVARSLTMSGFGVLRFDFTGLGGSDGEFASTDFSRNIGDLVAASDFLKSHFEAPQLLVGHSLGGTACLAAAFELPDVRAVATIGSPANPKHVTGLLGESLETIETTGSAEVRIGGRPFRIRKEFLDDLEDHPLEERLGSLGKALLLLHSPQDTIVGIDQAERLYRAARHPKSFITLDGADHLLSLPSDARYAGSVIASWAARYTVQPDQPPLKTEQQVVASLEADAGFTTKMLVGNHRMLADEPESFGGRDLGPSPYELVAAGLSACTAMTLQMYAKRKKWDLQHVEVHTSHGKEHALDCDQCESGEARIDTFRREIRITGDLDEKQVQKLLEIADKCPVHRTLHGPVQILTRLSP
ncbi:bifunctional alpha/beta hydrolase/OsmC family protein [Robiginitalea biformata]|uniref:Possible hydrolase n=1 Tax=Robiginitalea biformata (strain ATCC BAA-864 / DSM 15991 / KCTC 12146 / HTCC2501) TaxID=313596 RepID=A4CNR0_ROBBH|nr:bifunctional alpha/beta hydrolase/OsmC family protein [Robiginitalea biformata]EAR14527.1 possible hydrolase [Robiginitalea biformata HTCC2501]